MPNPHQITPLIMIVFQNALIVFWYPASSVLFEICWGFKNLRIIIKTNNLRSNNLEYTVVKNWDDI
jgi:hypothetical protein